MTAAKLSLLLALAGVLTACGPAAGPPGQPAPSAQPAAPPSPLALSRPSKSSGCLSQNGLPDPACTPGAVDPRVSQANIASTICTSGYTRTVRPPVTFTDPLKLREMAAYGHQGEPPAGYELDHLVSLELGGAPRDEANLWPEPWNGPLNAHNKDEVENYLHEQVCRGGMQLSAAQQQIAADWTQFLAAARTAR
jgi:hypothetical protein